MFFVWMILAIIAALCTSAVDGAAKSTEQLTPEKCKVTDICMGVSAILTVLVFMIGYYRTREELELFWHGEIIFDSLLYYAMMFSGIYGMIILLIAAIPYSIRKSLDSRSAFDDAQNRSTAMEDREPGDDEWKCKSCGKIHKNYVSTCSCGKSKYDQ